MLRKRKFETAKPRPKVVCPRCGSDKLGRESLVAYGITRVVALVASPEALIFGRPTRGMRCKKCRKLF